MASTARADAKAAGEMFFETGKPCPYGHVAPRYVSTWKCLECCRSTYAIKYADRYSTPEAIEHRKNTRKALYARQGNKQTEAQWKRARENTWRTEFNIYSAKTPWDFLKWPEFVEKLYEQQGVCWGCGKQLFTSVKGSCVADHCHKTGVFRHVLCTRCNVIEGAIHSPVGQLFLQDSAEFAEKYSYVWAQ